MQSSIDILTDFEQRELLQPEPPELPRRTTSLPPFPVQALPENFGRFAMAVAEEKQIPLDMAVGFMLGVLSAAVVGRVEIRPNARQPAYTEAAQLYIIVQGESSERKSSTMKSLDKPLRNYLSSQREAVRRANEGIRREMEVTENSIRHLKPTEEQRGLAMRQKRDELKASLIPETELIRSEGSVEAITRSMDSHGGRVILMSAEGQLLNILSGRTYARAGSAVNLDALLDAYSNDCTSGMRIRDGADWEIQRASASICLGVQPGLLRSFMDDREGRERGLHGRFLYFLPRSRIGRRRVNTDPVPQHLCSWWVETVQRVASTARQGEPLVLTFSREAEAAYLQFLQRVEGRLLSDLGGDMQPWGGKLAGNTVRLAGLLALTEGEDMVQKRQWDMAQYLAETYLIPHARMAFLGDDPQLGENARKLWKMLQGVTWFDQADWWARRGRYTFEDRQDYEEALRQLSDQGYIRHAAVQPPPSSTRKRLPRWDVVQQAVPSAPVTEGELA